MPYHNIITSTIHRCVVADNYSNNFYLIPRYYTIAPTTIYICMLWRVHRPYIGTHRKLYETVRPYLTPTILWHHITIYDILYPR